MVRPKHAYLLDLSSQQFAVARHAAGVAPRTVVRTVLADDADALAELMLEAYRGTIDDEGEQIEEARNVVADFFSDAPLPGASMIAFVDGVAASAVLVTSSDTGPFISFVFSRPEHQRTGLATSVVTAACRRLLESGANEVGLAITDGNVASEALFKGLGAVRLDR